MKNFLYIVSVAVFALTLLGSCDTESTYQESSSDAAYLSRIRLGTLKRTITTTNRAGGDSTYTSSISLANMEMVIDHNGGRIYNAVALPTGIDLSEVKFSALTSSGWMGVKSLATGNDTAFTTSGTYDLRVPRDVFVQSLSGKARHHYTLTLTLGTERKDSLLWTALPANTAIAELTTPRLAVVNDTLHLFGMRSGVLRHYVSVDGTDWQPLVTTGLMTQEGVLSLMASGQLLCAVEQGTLRTSHDGGRTWAEQSTSLAPTRLLGVLGNVAYVATVDSRVYAIQVGTDTMTKVSVVSAERLPTTLVNSVVVPARLAGEPQQLITLGRNAAGEMLAFAMYAQQVGSTADFFPLINDFSQSFALPAWETLHTTCLGRTIIAVGTVAGKPALRYSLDAGFTWREGKVYGLPAEALTSTGLAIATDTAARVWLISTGSGQVWRGQLQ